MFAALSNLGNKYSYFCIFFLSGLASAFVLACIDYYVYQYTFSKTMQAVHETPLFIAVLASFTALFETIAYCDSVADVELKPERKTSEELLIECIELMQKSNARGKDLIIQKLEDLQKYLREHY